MADVTDPADYCREVEAYLCRKNDGHLVRIVGPAFEQVCGWATRGVPLKAVFHGVDRYFERYYAKGPRRRPVRVEFCEADVFDVFDEWRRAVGVTGLGEQGGRSGEGGQGDDGPRKRGSLPEHLERVVARLTNLRGAAGGALDSVVDEMVREIDAARGGAKGLRGDARETLLARLRALDLGLLEAARGACDAQTLQQLAVEADAELAPFRARLPAETYAQSRHACIDRLIRERTRLPAIAFE